MLPPSDSLSHQSRKLAEVIADLRNRASSTIPPPSYWSTVPAVQLSEETCLDPENDDEKGPHEPALTPITVRIDASIKVIGHGNTIVLPSLSTGRSDSSSTASHTPSPGACLSIPSTTSVGQLQQQRQSKLIDLTTTVISALGSSSLLEDNVNGGRRPIELNINAGIDIKGSRNVVYAGISNKGTVHGPTGANGHVVERKRRAASEPTEIPKAKRPIS